MKIAVASQNRREITGHTGHCRKFWVYTVEDQQVQEKSLLALTKEQTFHALSPSAAWLLDDADILIAAGMGHGLARLLEARKIKPLSTTEKDPDKAIIDYLQNKLVIEPFGQQRHHHGKK